MASKKTVKRSNATLNAGDILVSDSQVVENIVYRSKAPARPSREEEARTQHNQKKKDRKRVLKYVEPVEHKQMAAAAAPMPVNPNGYYRLDNVLSRATESERKQIMRSMGMVAVNGDKLHFKTKTMKMDNKSKTQGKQNKANKGKFAVFDADF